MSSTPLVKLGLEATKLEPVSASDMAMTDLQNSNPEQILNCWRCYGMNLWPELSKARFSHMILLHLSAFVSGAASCQSRALVSEYLHLRPRVFQSRASRSLFWTGFWKYQWQDLADDASSIEVFPRCPFAAVRVVRGGLPTGRWDYLVRFWLGKSGELSANSEKLRRNLRPALP